MVPIYHISVQSRAGAIIILMPERESLGKGYNLIIVRQLDIRKGVPGSCFRYAGHATTDITRHAQRSICSYIKTAPNLDHA